MSITLQEIKQAACGIDAAGNSKSMSIVGVHQYNMFNTALDPKVIAEFSATEPIVNISTGGEITWISLKFSSSVSQNLNLYFRALERYLEEVEKNTDELQAVAFLTVMPIELGGQYYINAVHPIIWAIEPEAVGEDFRILRVAFFSEDVAFLESDFDDDFFDQALAAAQESSPVVDEPVNPLGYNSIDDRNSQFINSDKYIPDLAEDDDDDEYDDYDYNDEGDDDENNDNEPNDRSSYIYK